MCKWWTVFGWWDSLNRGIKLGPVTVALFGCPCKRWFLYVSVYPQRPLYDGLLRHMRRESPVLSGLPYPK